MKSNWGLYEIKKKQKKKQTERLCGEAVGCVVESSSWWLHMYRGKHMALHALRPAVKLAVIGTVGVHCFWNQRQSGHSKWAKTSSYMMRPRLRSRNSQSGGIHMTWIMKYQVKQIENNDTMKWGGMKVYTSTTWGSRKNVKSIPSLNTRRVLKIKWQNTTWVYLLRGNI